MDSCAYPLVNFPHTLLLSVDMLNGGRGGYSVFEGGVRAVL